MPLFVASRIRIALPRSVITTLKNGSLPHPVPVHVSSPWPPSSQASPPRAHASPSVRLYQRGSYRGDVRVEVVEDIETTLTKAFLGESTAVCYGEYGSKEGVGGGDKAAMFMSRRTPSKKPRSLSSVRDLGMGE